LNSARLARYEATVQSYDQRNVNAYSKKHSVCPCWSRDTCTVSFDEQKAKLFIEYSASVSWALVAKDWNPHTHVILGRKDLRLQWKDRTWQFSRGSNYGAALHPLKLVSISQKKGLRGWKSISKDSCRAYGPGSSAYGKMHTATFKVAFQSKTFIKGSARWL